MLHQSNQELPRELLVVRDVHREFSEGGVRTQVVRGVSLSLRRGDFVALVGPSGCGKSTLLSIIGLADRATRGELILDGVPLQNAPESRLQQVRRSQIGYVFQHFNLLSTLTVRENVLLPLLLAELPLSQTAQRVDELLERVNIAHRADALPHALSGGEMQRVAIARAVVHRPILVIADEPTGNLDSTNGERVLDLLSDLAADGVSVLMATHSEAAMGHCSRVLRMKDGVLV